MILQTINAHEVEPSDYVHRKTAKAVIINDEGNILMFPSTLLGGGVEEGETYEQALHREIMEEAGARVEIIKPLGTVIRYSDASKRKYLVEGFLCKYIDTVSAPTSEDFEQFKVVAEWHNPEEVVSRLASEVRQLEDKNTEEEYVPKHQSRSQNRQVALAFIKEAFS